MSLNIIKIPIQQLLNRIYSLWAPILRIFDMLESLRMDFTNRQGSKKGQWTQTWPCLLAELWWFLDGPCFMGFYKLCSTGSAWSRKATKNATSRVSGCFFSGLFPSSSPRRITVHAGGPPGRQATIRFDSTTMFPSGAAGANCAIPWPSAEPWASKKRDAWI